MTAFVHDSVWKEGVHPYKGQKMTFWSKFSDQRGGDATLPINLPMMKKLSILYLLTIHIHRQLLNANLYIGKLCQSSLCRVSARFHICWPALGPSLSWNLSSWWTLSLSSVYCHQTWTWTKNIKQRTMQSRHKRRYWIWTDKLVGLSGGRKKFITLFCSSTWQGFYRLIILLVSVDLIGEKNQVILEFPMQTKKCTSIERFRGFSAT